MDPEARPDETVRQPDVLARRDPRTLAQVVMALVLLGWALRALSPVLVPFVAAILIALAIVPVRDWVRARVPDPLGWLGTTAAMTLILLVLLAFFGGIWMAARQVVSELSRPGGVIADMLQVDGPGEQD